MVIKRSMLNWRKGMGQSAIGIYALCSLYMKPIWCNGFPETYASLEKGGEANLASVYMHCAIYS